MRKVKKEYNGSLTGRHAHTQMENILPKKKGDVASRDETSVSTVIHRGAKWFAMP